METAAQFDLTKAIQGWREKLASSPALNSHDLDELEQHLRDSITALQGKGLAAHEAFWVARGRLGASEALNAEFGKVNIEQVWGDRLQWMVTGYIAFGLGISFIGGLVTFTTVGLFKLTTPSLILGPGSLVLHVAMLAGFFLLLWQSGTNKDGLLWRTGCWLKTRPRTAGAIALLLTVSISAISASAHALAAKLMPPQTYSYLMVWRWPASTLLVFLYPVFLIWLMARNCSTQVRENL